MSNPLQLIQDPPWYHNGLSFKCTECGKCCTGSPGYVWLTEQEMYDIADYLKMSPEQFFQTSIRKAGGRYSLKEHTKTYDCLFLKDKKCRIYPVRPKQCRTFPWWPENLSSKNSWEETATVCEGIQEDAELVSLEEIESQMKEQSCQ